MTTRGSADATIEQALESALRAGRAAGSTELEAFASQALRRRIVVEHNKSKSGTSKYAQEICVRAVIGKRVGTAFANSLGVKDVADCARVAVRLAKARPPDPNWPGLPSPERGYRPAVGSSSESLRGVGFQELNDWCDEMVHAALGLGPGVTVTGGLVALEDRVRNVANSHGVFASDKSAQLEAACCCVSGHGEAVTPDCSIGVASKSRRLDFRRMGETSSLVSMLSSTPARSKRGRFDVVFSPQSLGHSDAGLLKWILGSALSGEKVIRGKTFLADMRGEEIAANGFSLADNPVSKTNSGSRAFDDEGVPTHRTVLVRKGVLESFLWDTYFGTLAGRESTGNAYRDPWSGSLTPAPFNLEVMPGRGSWEELVAEVDDGYLVWGCQGVHTSDVGAGKFSFVASPGLRIKRGEIVGGVRETMISGGMIELLKNIDVVGSDREDMKDCCIPSIRFRNVRVITG